MQVQPYLSFEGRCDEAIEFYKKAIGAKVDMLMRFKEAPDQSMVSPGNADKVMHAAVQRRRYATADVGRTLHRRRRISTASRWRSASRRRPTPNASSARWREGGKVNMPLAKTFFSSRFGMLADKFGVGWMVLVAP